jgi:hypothetical protein
MAIERNAQPRENSPFTPGQPAPPEIFTGRTQEIERLRRCIRQVAGNKPQAVFIGGARGLGKSSLARFCQFITEQDNPVLANEVKFLCAYNACGNCKSVLDVCQLIVQGLTAKITEEDRLARVRDFLGRYIQEVSLPMPGVHFKVRVTRNKRDLDELKLNMPGVIHGLWNVVKDKKAGLMVVLDDINGLSGQVDFANFIKSLWEEMAAQPLPILLMVVGLEERMDDLVQSHESVGRIFDRVILKPMPQEDVEQFFGTSFASVNLVIEEDAGRWLAEMSGGYPVMMHELGDATYWEDTDGRIDSDDAVSGLVEAAGRVGEKYFSRQVYDAVQSDSFRQILFHTVKDTFFPGTIRRRDLTASLPADQAKNLDNFFKRMLDLGVMVRVQQGVYRYAYPMFPVYLRMERSKQEAKKPR